MAVPMSSAMNVSGFSGRSVVEHRRHHKIGGEKNRMKKKKKMECWSNAGCSWCRVVRVRGFRTEEEKAQGSSDISLRSMFTEMKGKYGAFGGGATLEKSKLDLSQSTSRVSPQVSIPPSLPFFPFCLSGCGETPEGAFCSLATKLHASTFLKNCSQYVCQCLVQGINARIHHFFFALCFLSHLPSI
jgi:hypothetical protein